jgi:hypothetical protein
LVSDFAVTPLKKYKFSKFITRSESREEIELQQGTPEVLKTLQN